MFFNLLTQSTTSGDTPAGNNYGSLIMLAIMAVAIIALFVFNRRSNKKREEESKAMLAAIKPGNKVKTIGGICGIVVEVCPDDNTFVLETGTEKSGKSYIKFDMQAIYQTDAVAQKTAEEPKKETAKEEVKEEAVVAVVEETPAEENTDK